MSMKTTNLLTKTATVAVCLFAAVSVHADGKIKGVKALFEAPRVYRGTVQRYTFDPVVTANIRAGIADGRFERQVSDAMLQYSPIPAPVVLGHTHQEISRSLHVLVAAVPLEKEVLAATHQEHQFYMPEMIDAQELHDLVMALPKLDDESALVIASSILTNVKNHTLQTYLLQSLSRQDLAMLDKDLTEYFCLGKPFEIAAFNYTLRHPHQQVLMMRRLLNNPLVDEEVKRPVRAFLHKNKIKPEEFPAFQQAISNLQTQYSERLKAVQESNIIQTQVAYYTKLLERLKNFIVRHDGRRPEWNTKDPEEFQLFEEIEWVQQSQDRNLFEPLSSYHKALNWMWESAAPTYLTREDTVALFDEFVKTTGRIYPRSLRDEPMEGETTFSREAELWTNLSYWRVEDPSISGDLAKVYGKYPQIYK